MWSLFPRILAWNQLHEISEWIQLHETLALLLQLLLKVSVVSPLAAVLHSAPKALLLLVVLPEAWLLAQVWARWLRRPSSVLATLW